MLRWRDWRGAIGPDDADRLGVALEVDAELDHCPAALQLGHKAASASGPIRRPRLLDPALNTSVSGSGCRRLLRQVGQRVRNHLLQSRPQAAATCSPGSLAGQFQSQRLALPSAGVAGNPRPRPAPAKQFRSAVIPLDRSSG